MGCPDLPCSHRRVLGHCLQQALRWDVQEAAAAPQCCCRSLQRRVPPQPLARAGKCPKRRRAPPSLGCEQRPLLGDLVGSAPALSDAKQLLVWNPQRGANSRSGCSSWRCGKSLRSLSTFPTALGLSLRAAAAAADTTLQLEHVPCAGHGQAGPGPCHGQAAGEPSPAPLSSLQGPDPQEALLGCTCSRRPPCCRAPRPCCTRSSFLWSEASSLQHAGGCRRCSCCCGGRATSCSRQVVPNGSCWGEAVPAATPGPAGARTEDVKLGELRHGLSTLPAAGSSRGFPGRAAALTIAPDPRSTTLASPAAPGQLPPTSGAPCPCCSWSRQEVAALLEGAGDAGGMLGVGEASSWPGLQTQR